MIGLIPFCFTAIYNHSIIAAIVTINGILYHTNNNNKLTRYNDIGVNSMLVLFTAYSKSRTIITALLSFIIWWYNTKYPTKYENIIHIMGVTWILYIGHLDYLNLLPI
jgi:hypothetical protein